MNSYIFTRLRGRNRVSETFAPARFLHAALLCSLVFCKALSGQVCDKKATVYFESDRYTIQASEAQKLEKLSKIFAQKADTFLLEIDAFTDSIASAEYNYKLADNRLKAIVSYLKASSSCHFEINGRVRGEAQPLGSNATEEGRSKNRRVDIFYWKLKDGKITIKGKGGTEIDMNKDYFGSCGICGSNPKMTEVFTNEQAERQGISLATTDGGDLITGGMMNLELGCKEVAADWPCTDVVIRIPAAEYDEELEIWKVNRQSNPGNVRWQRDENGQLEYDAKNKCYIMRVNYCPGRGGMGSGINLDKPKVKDSTGLIAIPELTRTNKSTSARALRAGRIYGNRAMSPSMWRFSYKGKGSVFFADSGLGQNKVGYVFSGVIDHYEAECDTARCRLQKQCWCFEIPIDKYAKRIYFQKNKAYRLKVPWRYRNYTVKLFIPAADTVISVAKVKRSRRKYAFQQPLPETYVVVYGEQADTKDKRAYDGHVSLDEIRTKHSRRHNYYKARIKRKQLKMAIRTNS